MASAQLESNGPGLAESSVRDGRLENTGDGWRLRSEVIIHLGSSATQHVRFHFSGLSVGDVQFGHEAGRFTCPAPASFFSSPRSANSRSRFRKMVHITSDWSNHSLNAHLVVLN